MPPYQLIFNSDHHNFQVRTQILNRFTVRQAPTCYDQPNQAISRFLFSCRGLYWILDHTLIDYYSSLLQHLCSQPIWGTLTPKTPAEKPWLASCNIVGAGQTFASYFATVISNKCWYQHVTEGEDKETKTKKELHFNLFSFSFFLNLTSFTDDNLEIQDFHPITVLCKSLLLALCMSPDKILPFIDSSPQMTAQHSNFARNLWNLVLPEIPF